MANLCPLHQQGISPIHEALADLKVEQDRRLRIEGDYAILHARWLASRGARPRRGVADLFL